MGVQLGVIMNMNIKILVLMPVLSIFLISCEMNAPKVPRVLSYDEVPDEVKETPIIVNIDRNTNKEYPKLGNIPRKPTDFPTREQYTKDMDDLLESRSEAQSLKENFLEFTGKSE